MSKIFFDTEFTGLKKNTDLISIGLISDDGKEFYAEFTDFDKSKIDDENWITTNVLNNTIAFGSVDPTDVVLDETTYHKGTKSEIAKDLLSWFNQFDSIEMISDVCHYDYVLFIDIFGSAFDLPEKIPACCHDINQDIANYYMITDADAFDISREEILRQNGIYSFGDKHNSLYDARVIKSIYEIIKGI